MQSQSLNSIKTAVLVPFFLMCELEGRVGEGEGDLNQFPDNPLELQFVLLICTAQFFWGNSSAWAPACLKTCCASHRGTETKLFRYSTRSLVSVRSLSYSCSCPFSFNQYCPAYLVTSNSKNQVQDRMFFVLLPIYLLLMKEGIFPRKWAYLSSSSLAVRHVWICAPFLLALYFSVWVIGTLIICTL